MAAHVGARRGLSPWHTLVAALWASINCGFLYTFSTFSGALKDKFSLRQDQLNTIGMCQVAVGLWTWSCGILVDRTSVTVAVVFGGLLNSGSWLIFGAIASDIWQVSEPTLIFSILVALATYGGAFVTAGIFCVIANNFEDKRSGPIGIAKAWVGVAAGVATTVFVNIFPSPDDAPERLNFLWFLSATCAFFVFVPAPFVRVLQPGTAKGDDGLWVPEELRLRLLTFATLALVAATATAALLGSDAGAGKVFLSALILAIIMSPLILVCPRRSSDRARAAMATTSARQEPDTAELVGQISSRPSDGGHTARGVVALPSPWECGPLDMVRRPDAWFLWLPIFTLQAGGLLLTSNLGSMVDSRSGPHASAATAVATFSCAQSLGRLFGGTLSDILVRQRIARPWFLVLLTFCMTTAHVVLCMPGVTPLFLGTALAGWSFGSMYPTMIITIAELFGTARIASNYMVFDGSPSALASIVVAKYFAQAVYNSHAAPGSTTCFGDDCYRPTHVAVAMLQVVAGAAAICLAIRAKVVYELSIWPQVCTPQCTTTSTGALPSHQATCIIFGRATAKNET